MSRNGQVGDEMEDDVGQVSDPAYKGAKKLGQMTTKGASDASKVASDSAKLAGSSAGSAVGSAGGPAGIAAQKAIEAAAKFAMNPEEASKKGCAGIVLILALTLGPILLLVMTASTLITAIFPNMLTNDVSRSNEPVAYQSYVYKIANYRDNYSKAVSVDPDLTWIISYNGDAQRSHIESEDGLDDIEKSGPLNENAEPFTSSSYYGQQIPIYDDASLTNQLALLDSGAVVEQLIDESEDAGEGILAFKFRVDDFDTYDYEDHNAVIQDADGFNSYGAVQYDYEVGYISENYAFQHFSPDPYNEYNTQDEYNIITGSLRTIIEDGFNDAKASLQSDIEANKRSIGSTYEDSITGVEGTPLVIYRNGVLESGSVDPNLPSFDTAKSTSTIPSYEDIQDIAREDASRISAAYAVSKADTLPDSGYYDDLDDSMKNALKYSFIPTYQAKQETKNRTVETKRIETTQVDNILGVLNGTMIRASQDDKDKANYVQKTGPAYINGQEYKLNETIPQYVYYEKVSSGQGTHYLDQSVFDYLGNALGASSAQSGGTGKPYVLMTGEIEMVISEQPELYSYTSHYLDTNITDLDTRLVEYGFFFADNNFFKEEKEKIDVSLQANEISRIIDNFIQGRESALTEYKSKAYDALSQLYKQPYFNYSFQYIYDNDEYYREFGEADGWSIVGESKEKNKTGLQNSYQRYNEATGQHEEVPEHGLAHISSFGVTGKKSSKFLFWGGNYVQDYFRQDKPEKVTVDARKETQISQEDLELYQNINGNQLPLDEQKAPIPLERDKTIAEKINEFQANQRAYLLDKEAENEKSKRSGGGDSSALVEIARQEMGNAGGMKFISWFGGFGAGTPWCAIFASWVSNEAGLIEGEDYPRHAAVFGWHQWAVENDKFEPANGSYEAQPGDMVLYDWSGTGSFAAGGGSHIDIVVEHVKGQSLKVIGGNVSDDVQEYDATHSLNGGKVMGFVVMNGGTVKGGGNAMSEIVAEQIRQVNGRTFNSIDEYGRFGIGKWDTETLIDLLRNVYDQDPEAFQTSLANSMSSGIRRDEVRNAQFILQIADGTRDDVPQALYSDLTVVLDRYFNEESLYIQNTWLETSAQTYLGFMEGLEKEWGIKEASIEHRTYAYLASLGVFYESYGVENILDDQTLLNLVKSTLTEEQEGKFKYVQPLVEEYLINTVDRINTYEYSAGFDNYNPFIKQIERIGKFVKNIGETRLNSATLGGGGYRGKQYNIPNTPTSGLHHDNVGEFDLLTYVIHLESGGMDQEAVDSVTSAIFNRADQNWNGSADTPYKVITAPGQYEAYHGGSHFYRPWQNRMDADLSIVRESIKKHADGWRMHEYVFFFASGYFYQDGTWTLYNNMINASLVPYVYSYEDFGGNTFFDPKPNFPW